MRKIYVVDLSEEEKDELKSLTEKGKNSARRLNRARVLLLANEGETDKQIAKAVGVGTSTVELRKGGDSWSSGKQPYRTFTDRRIRSLSGRP